MFKYVLVLAFVATAVAEHEDAHAEIKYLNTDVNPHGFDYSFETTNHIRSAAQGDEHGNIKGDFEWVAPKGEHIDIKYVADENGYQPVGDVLPTPPPIPDAILKAIEYIRAHPSHEEQHYHGH
ncbi:larval cuticle protein 2-like [Cochliomyia hominivorax]